MHLFKLVREEDPTGISGTGLIAEGCQFSDGTCVLRWTTEHRSTAVYGSMEELEAIHGHGGSTRVVWVPPPVGSVKALDPQHRVLALEAKVRFLEDLANGTSEELHRLCRSLHELHEVVNARGSEG